MARKIGFYSIKKAAQEICKYVPLFTPIIQRLYPNNATLLAALATANAACAELVKEITLQETPGV